MKDLNESMVVADTWEEFLKQLDKGKVLLMLFHVILIKPYL